MGAAASVAELNDGEGFRAGATQVQSIIDSKGAIPTEKCGEIIQQYLDISAKAKKYFPGSRSGSWILKQAVRVMKAHGINNTNTLYSQSLCPDEINHEVGDISQLFASYLGEVFHLGGLAGIPFTGKSGFSSFSHHVPDGGNLFVLMAPHIGISATGALGKYSRGGQARDNAACGAAVDAYAHCCACKPMPDLSVDTADYQMCYIINEINKRKEIIQEKEALSPRSGSGTDNDAVQAELARQTYDIGKKMLDKVISTNFGNGKGLLCVLSGIQINMPRPFEDYFQPISFMIYRKDEEPVDILPKAFGWGAEA
jgi:hypothetical protein